MNLLGTDSDLCSKSKFKSISKSCGCININGCCIDLI